LSSIRRHTRFSRDWSSDVCSSDLVTVAHDVPLEPPIARDDRVLIDDVTGDFTADIDLLANDEDPDGTADDLEVAIDGVEMLPSEIGRASCRERGWFAVDDVEVHN